MLLLRDHTLEQGGRRKIGTHRRLELAQFGEYFVGADQIGVEHWPAAIDGPAIAVDPDDIDVGGTLRLAFLDDPGAFVDHWINATLENFLVGNGAALDTLPRCNVENDLLDER